MLQIVDMKIGDIKPFERNPKEHPKSQIAQIKRSIQEFGMLDPVAVDENNVLIEGHGRLLALQELDAETVPTIRLTHLSDAQKKSYIIGHNKMTLNSGFNEDLLSQLLTDIDAAGFDLEMTGFDLSEIDSLMSPKDCIEDNFDENEEKKKVEERGGAVTQTGDIWLLGEHRLICGDSTLPETFEKLMDGKKAQLCVTSCPYGVGLSYEKYGIEPWRELMTAAVKNICRNADTVVVNCGDLMTTRSQFVEPSNLYLQNMFADNGFRILWIRVWDKIRQPLSTSAPFHLATNKPVTSSEMITAYGTTGAAQEEVDESDYSFVTAYGGYAYKFAKRLTREQRREWGVSPIWRMMPTNSHKKDGHPAAFCVELPWRCIQMHSDKGNVVLEPFSGSGTTIIAAEQSERICYAIEKDPLYVDLAVRRYAEFVEGAEIYLLRNGEQISVEESGVLA